METHINQMEMKTKSFKKFINLNDLITFKINLICPLF